MLVKDIYAKLNELSPFDLQETWDNSGLQVGMMSQKINKIVLSIDIDEELLDALEEHTLLITHHPLIFSGLKALDFDRYPAKLLQKMVQKNIANIAMHTNFDITHLNDYVTKEVLGYGLIKKEGFVNYIEVNQNFDDFAKHIQTKLSLKVTKSVQCHDFVKTAAITTGSGGSLIGSIDAECFLTGDIKYHDAMAAKTLNLSLIEIGHFESEHYFSEILQKHLKILGLEAIIASSKNPFKYRYPKGDK